MENILFEEKQKPKQFWIWALLIVVCSMPLYGLYSQMVLGKPFGNNPMSNSGLVLLFCFLLLTAVFVLNITLRTKICKDGIYVKMFPFHAKFKVYHKESLAEAYVRKYQPVKEYGGWGLRYGFKNGIAFNVSGNMGLQLELKSGKKILIGSNKPKELEHALTQFWNQS